MSQGSQPLLKLTNSVVFVQNKKIRQRKRKRTRIMTLSKSWIRAFRYILLSNEIIEFQPSTHGASERAAPNILHHSSLLLLWFSTILIRHLQKCFFFFAVAHFYQEFLRAIGHVRANCRLIKCVWCVLQDGSPIMNVACAMGTKTKT